MARYLLNSPRLTAFGTWRYSGPLSLAQARAFIEMPFESAIGHAATARRLAVLLGVPVPCRRVSVVMQPGDEALVWQLQVRAAEGTVLDDAALAAHGAVFGHLLRLD